MEKNLMPDRPLIGRDGPLVAAVVARSDWLVDRAHVEAIVDTPADLRERIAALWLADAQGEHASAASYARSALELCELGAPPELISGCHQAAADEIRHAMECFTLASRYAGSPVGPAPLETPAVRRGTLEAAAGHIFVEGCVGETVAALVLTRSARRCSFATVQAALEAMAEDEAEHASVAWQTLAWMLDTGGLRVAKALREVVAVESERLLDPGSLRVDPESDVLLTHGRLSSAAEASTARDAWTSIVGPQLERLLADY
ncbi:MAG: hypothetical protein ACI9WU_002290 [Myxococcota bacterium]